MDLALNNLQRLICHKTQLTWFFAKLFAYACKNIKNTLIGLVHYFIRNPLLLKVFSAHDLLIRID